MGTRKLFKAKALALGITVGLAGLSTAAGADTLDEIKAQIEALQKKIVELEHKQDKTEQKQAAAPPGNVVTGGATKGSFKLPGSDTQASAKYSF